MNIINIRWKYTLVLLLLVLSACTSSKTEENLVVVEWSGYELPEFRESFTEQHPDTVNDYSFFSEDAEAYSKIQSGFEFDLVHPCASWWQLYVNEGLVQPIDTSKITHWDNIFDSLVKQGQFNGEQYFIPWDWGYDSILVRTDLVENIPGSWSDLIKEEYKGKIAMYDGSETNFVAASVALGLDPYNVTEEEIELIKDYLIALKSNALTYWSDYTDLNQMMLQGDTAIGVNAWNETYAILLENGYEVEYLSPKEGRLGWACGYGISTDTKNLDLVYDYLNAILEPQSMANMANGYYYGISNSAALPLLDEKLVELMELSNPSILDSTFFYQSLSQENREQMSKVWSEVKASK
ncbi:MAG: extracellular solute-binding protein [Anaerolineaceae bacterium]|nr:extracellular solute-binding protein [Anaerolineaceae bacterium]